MDKTNTIYEVGVSAQGGPRATSVSWSCQLDLARPWVCYSVIPVPMHFLCLHSKGLEIHALRSCTNTHAIGPRLQVMDSPGVRTDPALTGPEIAAICRHFGSSFSSENNANQFSAEDQPGRVEANLGDAAVSYRTFLAWIDPLDIGRVAKRWVRKRPSNVAVRRRAARGMTKRFPKH